MYKRVLIKVSGEALAGEKKTGIDDAILEKICKVIKTLSDDMKVQVAVVVGGGNFWRGAKRPEFDRSTADHIGMLATVMNALAMGDMFRMLGKEARVMCGCQMDDMAELFTKDKAVRHLNKGRIVILSCGTGSPYFSTDTGAALRAAELECDAIMLAKNIDAVYDDDPAKNPNAKRYDKVSFSEVLDKKLQVMDLTATAFCSTYKIPVQVFGVSEPENIIKAIKGENIGTLVYND